MAYVPPEKKKTEGNADSFPAFYCTCGGSCGAGARMRRNEKHRLVSINKSRNIDVATQGIETRDVCVLACYRASFVQTGIFPCGGGGAAMVLG